ncbi:MAG: FecR family protein [bacterium]
MSELTDWSLLAKFLSDECSEDEHKKIEAWIQSDEKNRRLLERMRLVWNSSEYRIENSDVPKLWQQVANRAGIRAQTEKPAVNPQSAYFFRQRLWTQRLPSGYTSALRYTAVALLAIALPYFIARGLHVLPWQNAGSQLQTLMVENQKRTTLTLSDGTTVTLDAGSKLEYPAKFADGKRELFLDGEGFFEVTSNPEKPFVVYAQNAVVQVLGTRFNVRAWQINRRVQVAVVEGEVSLAAVEVADRVPVVISKGQMSWLPENGLPTQPRIDDVEKYLGWMHNEVIFEDTPLREVLAQLQRWYNLQFVLADPAVAEEHVTVHIQEKSVDDILDLLSALTGLKCQRQGETVYLGQK